MNELTVHSGRKLWSLEALALEFDIDRRTVKRRIEHIPPDGTSPQGYPRWYVANVCLAILGYTQGDSRSPDELPPRERLDHYKAEREKMNLEQSQGLLVEYDVHREEIARILKVIANFFDTVPDVFEREFGFDGHQVKLLEELCDKVRNQLAELIGDRD